MRAFIQMSALATWSRRIALLSVQLFLLTVVLHRFASLATPVAIKLFGLAVLGAGLAGALGVAALVQIWREGYQGIGRAILALAAAAIVLAGPAWSLPRLISLPRVNDVTTDSANPPRFDKLVVRHELPAGGGRASGVANPYPDLAPLVVGRPVDQVFEMAQKAAQKLGWRVVEAVSPQPGQPGRIEAVDRSLIFGFKGDIAVRIEDDARHTRINVRSASRYGEHDLGRNAQRIRDLFLEVKTAVADMEQAEKMERLARIRAEREKRLAQQKAAAQKRKQAAFDAVSQQWRAPQQVRRSDQQPRPQQPRRRYRSTQELRRFWESMGD